MRYERLILEIDSHGTDVVAIRARSPVGEARVEVRHPAWIEIPAGPVREISGEPPSRHLVGEPGVDGTPVDSSGTGATLYSALASGPVAQVWAESRALASARGAGLRIEISVDPDAEGSSRLLSIPWELLYRRRTREFLALCRDSPIIRCLQIPRPRRAGPLPSPLRVLQVSATPADLPPLDLEGEEREIAGSLPPAAPRRVEIERTAAGTLEAVREALLDGAFHAVHFMGHGGFDTERGRGSVELESPGRGRDRVDAATFAAHLRSLPELRLVFLNACRTACGPLERGSEPFGGVGAALLLAGIPAVVAMREAIEDGAAIAFARTVYRQLARGDSLEGAVTEGRLALHRRRPDSTEWAIPTLFLRAGAEIEDPEAAREASRVRTGARTGGVVIDRVGGDVRGNVIVGGDLRDDRSVPRGRPDPDREG